MSHYRTGTISLTNGSLSVVGSGTDFISGAAVGECVSAPDGKIYEIASIQSATALTLGTVYLGSTSSGQAYSIVPTQSYLRDLALQAATLVNDYQSVLDSAGAGKFGDGTLGSPGMQFSSDSNTGLRRTGTDAVALVTGGVDRITVDAAGAVDVVASLSVAGSAVPTLTSTSTLTNKTLTAPVLANPSYSGATANGGTVTTIDINGGTIDGTVIGGTTPAAGSFTTLSVTETAGGRSFRTSAGSIKTKLASADAGWATSYGVEAASSSLSLADFGAFGSTKDTSAYSYVAAQGQDFSTATLKVTTAGATVTGALTTTGAIVSTSGGLTAGNGTITGAITYSSRVEIGASSNHNLGLITNNITQAVLDTSGNLGLGVTPSAFPTTKTLEMPNGVMFSSWQGYSTYGILQNNYHDGTSWKYKTTNVASRFCANDGNTGGFQWYTAPSGTAGNAITFTQAMTLDANGNLGLGVTPGGTEKALIFPDTLSIKVSLNGQVTGNYYAIEKRAAVSGGDGAFKFVAGNTAAGEFVFSSGGSNKAVLDASGNLSATGGITTGSYTVATRPAHAAGRIIHVTDGGAGAVFQGSAGGAWVNLG